jgi:hypothetical protein
VYKSNTEARSRNHCCRGKAISIKHSECVHVVLVNQHANRMHGAIFYLWALRLHRFSMLPNKWHDYWKLVTALIFSTFVRNISHSKNNSARYCHKCTNFFIKIPVILTNVNNNLQRMHFSYIYHISQYSYMFRSIWTILRESYSKKIKCFCRSY